MKKPIYLFTIFIFVLAVGYLVNSRLHDQAQESLSLPEPSSEISLPSSTPTDQPGTEPLKSAYLISGFSFQSQAPLGNWDALHEEACEEASLILTKYWLSNASLSAQAMENEIQALVAWEGSHDYPVSITAEQLVAVAKSYYHLGNLSVLNNVSIEMIKEEIAAGHPVIVPAAGRLLGNPNFTPPGPVYHMVVAIGYDQGNIIVQDVGTRKGDHYKYNPTIFFNAIHDWAGSPENIEKGSITVVVVE